MIIITPSIHSLRNFIIKNVNKIINRQPWYVVWSWNERTNLIWFDLIRCRRGPLRLLPPKYKLLTHTVAVFFLERGHKRRDTMITMRSIARMRIPRVLWRIWMSLTKSMGNLPPGRRLLLHVVLLAAVVGVDARRTMALHSGCSCVSVPPCVY